MNIRSDFLALPFSVIACTPSTVVQSMAAEPLKCPEEKITAEGYVTVTATGCGRQTTYTCHKNGCYHDGPVVAVQDAAGG